MFDDPPAKPQTVGDLIGRSFRLYRRHLGLVFRTLLGPTIIAAVGALGIQFYIYRIMENSIQPAFVPYIACTGSVLIVLMANLVLTVRQLAFVRMAAGFDSNYATAHQWMSRRKGQLFVLFLIGFGVLFLLLTFWVIEILVAALLTKAGLAMTVIAAGGLLMAPIGIMVSLCVLFLVGFISLSVLACEKHPIGSIINRGLSLTFGDFWRTLAFGLLLYAVVTAITIPLTLPLFIVSGLDVYQHGLTSATDYESYQMPLYLMVFSQIYQSLLNMLLWPVAFMAFGLLYHDLRLRQEGLDIRRQLDALERTAR